MKTQTKVCITSCQDVAYLREGATSALRRIMFVIVPALLGPHLYSWVLVLPRDDGFSTHGFWSFMHAPVFYVRRFWEVKKRRRRRFFLAFFLDIFTNSFLDFFSNSVTGNERISCGSKLKFSWRPSSTTCSKNYRQDSNPKSLTAASCMRRALYQASCIMNPVLIIEFYFSCNSCQC